MNTTSYIHSQSNSVNLLMRLNFTGLEIVEFNSFLFFINRGVKIHGTDKAIAERKSKSLIRSYIKLIKKKKKKKTEFSPTINEEYINPNPHPK